MNPSGFYTKTLSDRQTLVREAFKSDMNTLMSQHIDLADKMIENCIGCQVIPLGLGLHFLINNRNYSVPMATEEPSVIAAASNAAKIVKSSGGFIATADANIVCAQLSVRSTSLHEHKNIITLNKRDLISKANSFCPRMLQRGGGVCDIICRLLPRHKSRHIPIHPLPSGPNDGWLVIHFLIDACDAMGANVCSQVAEGITPEIQALLQDGLVSIRIVSNFNDYRFAYSSCKIPFSALATQEKDGETVANSILEAYAWAVDDPYRACTHNKGVMNGVTAVALATGQDSRAIEANVHSVTAINAIDPLTSYDIENDHLVCQIKIPLPVGTAGGSINTLSSTKTSLKILGSPNVQELSMVSSTYLGHGVCRASLQYSSIKSTWHGWYPERPYGLTCTKSCLEGRCSCRRRE